MLYGLQGIRGLDPRKMQSGAEGYYGFRLRNTLPLGSPGSWWRVVEIEFCAGRSFVAKYNGTSSVIASSASGSEPASRVFDGNLTTTGGVYGSGWGSSESGTVIGQYIGMTAGDRVPLRSARFLTWGNTDHNVGAVALDAMVSSPGDTETWVELAARSGVSGGGQWFGWEDL